MENADTRGLVPDSERSPLEVAQERWGVNLNDDHATLKKLAELQGKMPDAADLSNLWRAYQEQKDGKEEMKEAA